MNCHLMADLAGERMVVAYIFSCLRNVVIQATIWLAGMRYGCMYTTRQACTYLYGET